MTVDARAFLIKNKTKSNLMQLIQNNNSLHPAIVLTGQHHARELISSSMALFPILKMLHGFIHGD